jgi:hypothetical protein
MSLKKIILILIIQDLLKLVMRRVKQMTNIIRLKQGETLLSNNPFREVYEVALPKVEHKPLCIKRVSISRNKKNGKLRCSTMAKELMKYGFDRGQNIRFEQTNRGLTIHAVDKASANHIFAVVNKGRELGNLEIQGEWLEGFTVGKVTMEYYQDKIVLLKEEV